MNLHNFVSGLIASGRPWLHDYGLAAVGVGPFAETFMFTGLWFPGLAVLLAAGYLSAAKELPCFVTLILAWTGAIAGDQASYLLGHTVGDRLLRRKRKLSKRLKRGLEEQAPWLLMTYHYLPPIRAILPCIAGATRLRFRLWIVFDTLGVFFWVSAYFALGYLAYGVLSERGSIILQAVNAFVSIAVLWIVWRVYKSMARYAKEEREQEAEPGVV